MILTIFISLGFKENISDKIRGFSSDIQIINYDANHSFDYSPVSLSKDKTDEISKLENVESISGFITKPSILKYKNNIEGIVLKAYEKKDDYEFIKTHIISGEFPNFENNEILISEAISKKLKLKVGQKVLLYFIQDPIRFRKLKVSGIYKTDVYEFDQVFAIVSIKILQKINQWKPTQFSGYETVINNKSREHETQEEIDLIVRPEYYPKEKNKALLMSKNTFERFPHFFQWFELFNTNVIVIIFLMISVAIVNLISALLILILENTKLIGLLKTFGSNNASIRHIFIYLSAYLTIKGLFWGNVIALTIAFIQYNLHLIPLDAKNYYISYVPIEFDWKSLVILNITTMTLIICTLLIPVNYISRIIPVKVIRFN